jgi:hypothetical protein
MAKTVKIVHVPKKKRKSNPTPYNTAIIGLLIRVPNAQLVGGDKQTADRMVGLGWLSKGVGKKPEKAGLYEYEIDTPIYVPTPEGLAIYNEHSILKNIPPKQLQFASRLTAREERLYSTYSSREKRAEKKKSVK